VLGLERGAFAAGRPADFVSLDLDAVFTVEPERFRSMSRNTPWGGTRLRGAIAATYRAGRRVYPG
jgi:dihydroorotase